MTPTSAPQILEKNLEVDTDLRYELLKDDVIGCPKRQPTPRKLPVSLPSSEWRNSWRMIKNRMRRERRRYGPDLQKPLGALNEDVNWKDPWKLTCQLLNQNPDSWQRGSPTLQIHENWTNRGADLGRILEVLKAPASARTWTRFGTNRQRKTS